MEDKGVCKSYYEPGILLVLVLIGLFGFFARFGVVNLSHLHPLFAVGFAGALVFGLFLLATIDYYAKKVKNEKYVWFFSKERRKKIILWLFKGWIKKKNRRKRMDTLFKQQLEAIYNGDTKKVERLRDEMCVG